MVISYKYHMIYLLASTKFSLSEEPDREKTDQAKTEGSPKIPTVGTNTAR